MILKLYDIVRTPAGNIAVVDSVSDRGDVSLNFIRGRLPNTNCINAWWQKDNEYLRQYGYSEDAILPYHGLKLLYRVDNVIDVLLKQQQP